MSYTTWNPSDKSSDITLSNGNLTATLSNFPGGLRSVVGKSSGKYYWEITIDGVDEGSQIGVGKSDVDIQYPPYNVQVGDGTNGYGYDEYTGNKCNSSNCITYGISYGYSNIISVALDIDNGKVWFAKNGTWQASGDPGAGAGEAYSGLSGVFYAMASMKTTYGSPIVTANFGASAFSYSVPSGFIAGLGEDVYEISEDINITSEFNDNFGEFDEVVNALSVIDDNWPEVDENVSVNSVFESLGSDGINEEASVNSELIAAHSGELSEEASVNAAFISEHTGELSEDALVNTEFEVAILKTIQDTLSSWDNLKWGWQKSIADSLTVADTAEKILGIPVKDWLTVKDSELTNWNGVESVSDSFYAVDMSKVIKVYSDLIADGMAVADAVKSALGLIIKDIFTCVDTALNIGQFQHSISDLLTLEDIAKRFFPKSVSDSFAVADISLVDFLALLQISDSLNMVDTADRLLTINKAIADSLDVLDVVTIKQLIQELMQDGLNISASVIIDGEVYECWVLNTSSFHPSVYSNYEFNSFCIDKSNNICYGCKSDGIYTLEGDTDNGTDIKAGIILPDTDFGSSNKKRFRKAWLAVEGNNLLLKVETESGSRTYGMTDTEISLTRDLKGRSWKFSVEGFDSLDSINLVPIILSKR